MNLANKLLDIPMCRWATFRSDDGPISVYRCDTEDSPRYIIEGPGPGKTRLNYNKAVNFLRKFIDEGDDQYT
jgi:hypothetical protein